MKALAFLLLTQLKNRFLSLKKKPGFLILYSFITLIVVGSIIAMIIFGDEMPQSRFADERIIFLILSGLGLLFIYSFTVSGLSTGSSLFTMPDVGLLFVAPVSSKKILMYGLLSTLGKSLLGSIFIFYQIGNLKTSFGYGFKEIFALFIIFAIMILFCQLLSIGIYIFSNGDTTRKTIVKVLVYSLFGALIITYMFMQRQEQTGALETVLHIVDSEKFGYIPVAGWAAMFFIGIVHNSMTKVIIAIALFLIMGAVIVILLTVGKADYYEDVLLSTETTFQKMQAVKEGRNMPQTGSKKIKVRDNAVGIGNGSKAMAIFYRHLLEYRRKSRLLFVDNYTLFMMIAAGIAGYNFKTRIAPAAAYYGLLATGIYFQYFMTIMGKLRMELTKPYIYLIPDTSINKVFAASLASLLKPCVDGICIFAVLAAVSGHNVLECIFFALAYAASGAVFVGMTILYQRVLGGQPGKLVQAFLGVGLLFAVMAPSIGASVAAAFLLPETLQFLCTLPYSFFCLLFALILFVTCGNLIDKAEYTGNNYK
jgi:hypothetical protein